MTWSASGPVVRLMQKGVKIHCPESVYISPEVDLDLVSNKGVIIYPGCRIYGARTVIMEHCVLGADGPVTIRNCQLGRGVKLASGVFEESCFLDGASMGPGAHVRECCLLEEGARGAHTVGIKHTILFPFVTLGSLINFCDCLMAGGTDEKNHSEVGSSYIHFNYTPNQDKATASLIGDVPKGVMLNQPPIFLGGQGGIVGPVRITYGVVVAAGTIVRKDVLQENTVLLGHSTITKRVPRRFGLYSNVKRIIELNSQYIANLIALRTWYIVVRSHFLKGTRMGEAVCNGAINIIERAIKERVKRLGEIAERMDESIRILSATVSERSAKAIIKRKKEFQNKWPQLQEIFKRWSQRIYKDSHWEIFEKALENKATVAGLNNYIATVKSLEAKNTVEGSAWLQAIVDMVLEEVWEVLPSFRIKEM